MNCEMCGSENGYAKAIVEGVALTVCISCASYGNVIEHIRPETRQKKSKTRMGIPEPQTPEIEDVLVDDFASKIKSAREKNELTQKELAGLLNEKESVLQKIEGGHFEPPLSLAKKLELQLGLTLIESVELKKPSAQNKSSQELTLGDIIQIRKRRK